MFRRRRRRFASKPRLNSVTHVPSTMNNVVMGDTSIIFYFAVPANYAVIGTAVTADTFENADRSQAVQVGAKIGRVTIDFDIRSLTADGTIEYAVFKVERANVVPDTDGVLLPTNASIIIAGLQQTMRQFQPGRILNFGLMGVAAEQPRAKKVVVDFSKYRLGTMRTGDYYGIIVHSKNTASVVVDFQARYKAYQ